MKRVADALGAARSDLVVQAGAGADPQSLNRVLALRIDLQNTLFATFESLLEARIAIAGPPHAQRWGIQFSWLRSSFTSVGSSAGCSLAPRTASAFSTGAGVS
jgi:hypothetical protein